MVIKYLDSFLNSITMYKLALYSLLSMAIFSVLVGFLGRLPYHGIWLLVSLISFVFFCYGINVLFAKLFNAPATADSSVISALILFFIMSPAENLGNILIIFLISLVAMASKYIIAINKKHIFNPATFAAVVFGFTQNWGAVWWIANLYMLPLVCIVGFLIVRKIRRFSLFFSCIMGFALAYFMASGLSNILPSLRDALVSWPILFFSTIMLTEPSTTPPKKFQQIIYGFFVGIFLGNPIRIIGNIFTTPEITLALGNIFSFFVSLKRKVKMKLKEKIAIAKDCYEFVFNSEKKLNFQAGQYLEWSLPHGHQDSRGVRRYFTISSAPNQEIVSIGVRFSEKPSSFKKNLLSLARGETIFAGNLSGDFTLPKNKDKKYVFIAGGIGITPFCSMIRDLINKGKKTDVVLFYANKTPEDVGYTDLLREAQKKIGLKTIYILDSGELSDGFLTEKGFINNKIIQKYVPDFQDRIFYLSGPAAMVDNYRDLIKSMGVSNYHIKTDYFPGFA